MKLTTLELACVRSRGFYVTEKCDACGKLLNQTVHYTIAGTPEVFCSAACRDLLFFRDHKEAIKHSTPGKCAFCGSSLQGRKRGTLFCDDVCRMRYSRGRDRTGMGRGKKSRTTTQLDQRVANLKTGR